jgi:hypothetical protein
MTNIILAILALLAAIGAFVGTNIDLGPGTPGGGGLHGAPGPVAAAGLPGLIMIIGAAWAYFRYRR